MRDTRQLPYTIRRPLPPSIELTYTLTPASNAPAHLQGVASWVSAGELKTINIVSETQVKEWSVY